MTNILASLVVMVVTNVYSPKQYLQVTYGMSNPVTVMERWVDAPLGSVGFGGGMDWQTRDNPDVQYEEIREIKKYVFLEHGIPDFVISDTLKSKVKRTRVVQEKWVENVEVVLPPQRFGLATNVIHGANWTYTNTIIVTLTNEWAVSVVEATNRWWRTNKADRLEAR